MRYADHLREMFPDLNPGVDGLFLLEAHQIAGLSIAASSRTPGKQHLSWTIALIALAR